MNFTGEKILSRAGRSGIVRLLDVNEYVGQGRWIKAFQVEACGDLKSIESWMMTKRTADIGGEMLECSPASLTTLRVLSRRQAILDRNRRKIRRCDLRSRRQIPPSHSRQTKLMSQFSTSNFLEFFKRDDVAVRDHVAPAHIFRSSFD
jgi:hypothetical protein